MNHIKRGISIAAVALTSLFVLATTAYATTSPLDGVSTEVEGGRDELLDFVVGTALPVLFSILLVGVGIRLGVKYLRRASASA